jgi:hypothetical protein
MPPPGLGLLSLHSREPLGARSVTNSPCRCAWNFIKTCIATATSLRGGPIFRSPRSRWRETSGWKPGVIRTCRMFLRYRLSTKESGKRISDSEKIKISEGSRVDSEK